ncbi:MAG: NUDIX domain-containing protein [Eisenbergiella massiliensis]
MEKKAPYLVRLTGILVEEGRSLIIRQHAGWTVRYLPGGQPEPGETIEKGIIREMREETGAGYIFDFQINRVLRYMEAMG